MLPLFEASDGRPFGVNASFSGPGQLLAIAIAATAILLPAWSFAERGRDQSLPPAEDADFRNGIDEADSRFEATFVELLAAGKQGDAERFLGAELDRYPLAMQLVAMLDHKSEIEVHQFKMQNFAAIRPAQRALFLQAVCEHSRFELTKACALLNTVWMLDQRTTAARCAYCVLWLDSKQLRQSPPAEVDRAFTRLRRLADAHPDDLMIRWMLAIACRTWWRNEEGVGVYKQILDKWQPGPVLVHQTYANLLDKLDRYDEALVERYVAVRMAPAWYTNDGLGNTLRKLSRFDEACAAHATATGMNPHRSSNWSNWAAALDGAGKHEEAIEKCQRALAIDPQNWRAYWIWGSVLAAQGRPHAALGKCRTATAIYAECPRLNELVAELEKQVQK